MICVSTNKVVMVEDCENCLTDRLCPPVCFKRGFIWGTPDNTEPIWELTLEQAYKSTEDVSVYYENNNETVIKISIKCKEKIPKELRWEIWERDNYTCQICGSRKFLSIDHVVPESKGGKLIANNLQTLCCKCNSIKGNRL